jgi:mannobiose 2-epimerase
MAQATQEGLQPDGSLYHEYDRTARHYDKHREWGVSAEAMVGYLNAFQLSSKVEYLNNSIYAWKFAQKNLLDQEQGEWFWGVSDDYNIMDSEDKVGFWKCPYHHTRACLEIINRCHLLSR